MNKIFIFLSLLFTSFKLGNTNIQFFFPFSSFLFSHYFFSPYFLFFDKTREQGIRVNYKFGLCDLPKSMDEVQKFSTCTTGPKHETFCIFSLSLELIFFFQMKVEEAREVCQSWWMKEALDVFVERINPPTFIEKDFLNPSLDIN